VVEHLLDLDVRLHPSVFGSEPSQPVVLSGATEVVIAGSSAGGLGMLLGIDQIAEQLQGLAAQRGNHHITIRGLVDSGFFVEHTSDYPVEVTHHVMAAQDEAVTEKTIEINGNKIIDYAKAMRDVFSFANISAGAHPGCLHAHRSARSTHGFLPQSDCIFAAHLIPHLRTPVFFIQPQYDTWQILHIHSQGYTAAGVNEYGARLVQQMKYALFEASSAGHGAFVDSCTHHGMFICLGRHENTWSGRQVRSTIDVNTTTLHQHGMEEEGEQTNWNAADAFARWYRHSLRQTEPLRGLVAGLNWYFQERRFPCSDCCACSPRIAGQFAPTKSKHTG
jgi:hypothetical protein